jgi:hypothetical protein
MPASVYTEQEVRTLLEDYATNAALVNYTKLQDVTNSDFEARIAKLEQGAPPPPTKKAKIKFYLPWYGSAMRSKARELTAKYPDDPFVFTLNPNSGPGTSPRSDLQADIDYIKSVNLNVEILCYVWTKWGTRPLADVIRDISTYVQFYKKIDGVMFDESSNQTVHIPYYRDAGNHARSLDLRTIRLNPGASVPEGYMDIAEIVSINETSGLISKAQLQSRTFSGKYPRERFNYLAHTTAWDPAWLQMASEFVGIFYLTDRPGPPDNPWNQPATYADEEMAFIHQLNTTV